MKTMLYVGASLMIGASVYGFVDYRQTRDKKEFHNLYQEMKTEPAVNHDEVVTAEPASNESSPAREKKVRARKDPAQPAVNAGEVKAVSPIADDEQVVPTTVEIVESPARVESRPEATKTKKVKKHKKLDHRIFSRAPLRPEEEEVEAEILEESTDTKKERSSAKRN